MARTADDIRKVLDRAGDTIVKTWQGVQERVRGSGDDRSAAGRRDSAPSGRDRAPIPDRSTHDPLAEPEPTRDAPVPSARRDAAGGTDLAYQDMTVSQLRDLAADRDITGRSKMNKGALISALRRADAAGDEPAGVSYEDMTVDQLRDIAADREIEGRSTMTKDQLVRALRNG